MGRGHKFGVGHGGILLFYIKVVLLDFYGERHPAFCLCRIMVLALPVVDGLDFQFVAVTLELLILFGGGHFIGRKLCTIGKKAIGWW